MAFCEGCGSVLVKDACFCEICGRPVPQDATAVDGVASDAPATRVAQTLARAVKEISSAAPNELGESVIASWKGSSF